MKPQQLLYLNPDKILVPEKYNGHPNSGFDIAFIGFEESHLKILDKYFETLENTNNLKLPFFED